MAVPVQRSEQSAGDAAASGIESSHVVSGTSSSQTADGSTKLDGEASDPRPLRKSVSFPQHITDSDEAEPMARGARSRVSARETDSSADERTGILGSERGGTRSYATTSDRTEAEGRSQPQTTKQRRRSSQQPPSQKRSDSRPRWKKLLEKYGAVELENKGSVARDHLALERTFLAWLRTSLSFASIGIAITQLFRLNTSITGDDETATKHLRHVGKPLGATFIGISIIVLFIGFHRYFESQHYVIRGKFPASRGSIVLVALIAGLLIIASLIVILAIGKGVWES